MEKHKFSQFDKPISNKYNPTTVGLYEIFNRIKSDPLLRSDTLKVREGGANKLYQLDCVTFSGVFTQRVIDYLERYSDLLCLDIDNVKNPEELKEKIAKSKVPATLMFTSPSGKGLKVVVLVKGGKKMHLTNFNYYERYFKRYFNIQIDRNCKDITRACLLCHDKNVYFKDPEKLVPFEITAYDNLILDFARQFILDSKNGEKHYRLRNISYLLGGMCSGGILEANVAIDCLKQSIIERGDLKSEKDAFKTIDKSLTEGMKKPIEEFEYKNFVGNSYETMSKHTVEIEIPTDENESIINIDYPEHFYDNLPKIVNDILAKFRGSDNSSVLLFTFLAIVSGMFSNFRFYHRFRPHSVNLSCLLVAPSASFKGDAGLIKGLFSEIETHLNKMEVKGSKKTKRFFMTYNISDSEIYNRLKINDDKGVFFDTEISSLTSSGTKDWGSKLSTIIRKVVMNEEIQKLRAGDEEDTIIKFPCVSSFITGTASQLEGLFGKEDDGTFSRFIFLSKTRTKKWQRGLLSQTLPNTEIEKKLIYDFYKHYLENTPKIVFPKEIEDYYDDILEEIYEEYKYDDLLTSVVFRHGLYTLKTACILKLLEKKYLDSEEVIIDKKVLDTALVIIRNSILVASNISYNMEKIPLTNEQRLMKKLSTLNREFTLPEAVKLCENICSEATVYRICRKSNYIKKVDKNKYRIISNK